MGARAAGWGRPVAVGAHGPLVSPRRSGSHPAGPVGRVALDAGWTVSWVGAGAAGRPYPFSCWRPWAVPGGPAASEASSCSDSRALASGPFRVVRPSPAPPPSCRARPRSPSQPPPPPRRLGEGPLRSEHPGAAPWHLCPSSLRTRRDGFS